MATHSSILAWSILDRGARQATVHGAAELDTAEKTWHAHTHTCWLIIQNRQATYKGIPWQFRGSVQFSSGTQSCPTLCDLMNCSTPGLPVHHQLPEFTQTHVRRVLNAIQPSHPGSSPSPPVPNPSQHQSLFQ